MDLPNSELLFEILTRRISVLKKFNSLLQARDGTSLVRSRHGGMLEYLEMKGEAAGSYNDTSLDLFTYFSSALYFTGNKSRAVKFSLNNFVSQNYEVISNILDDLGLQDSKMENYISNIMNGEYDFEITLVLLCAMYNLNPEIYFQDDEIADSFPDEICQCILPTGDGNIKKFIISLPEIHTREEDHVSDYLDQEYHKMYLERDSEDALRESIKISKIALKKDLFVVILKHGSCQEKFSKYSIELPSMNTPSVVDSQAIIKDILDGLDSK